MSYAAKLAASAIRDLDQAPPRVVSAIVEFIHGPLGGNPRRLGKPLRDDLERLWSARRSDYRVLYSIDDDKQVIVVVRIGHRGHIYKSRTACVDGSV